MAKNDLRNQVKKFMTEANTTESEFAYALGISEGELQQILNGNGEITLTTFAKILIATGNALQILPIKDTPMGRYDNFGRGGLHGMPIPPRFGAPTRCDENFDNEFDDDYSDDDFDDVDDGNNDECESLFDRPCHGFDGHHPNCSHRVPPHRPSEDRPTRIPSHSPFASMTRDKLKEIIKNKLWDSEIDIERVTFKDLVDFLDKKDAQIRALKDARRNASRNEERREEPRQQTRHPSSTSMEPHLERFKNSLKRQVQENPAIKDFLKSIIGE